MRWYLSNLLKACAPRGLDSSATTLPPSVIALWVLGHLHLKSGGNNLFYEPFYHIPFFVRRQEFWHYGWKNCECSISIYNHLQNIPQLYCTSVRVMKVQQQLRQCLLQCDCNKLWLNVNNANHNTNMKKQLVDKHIFLMANADRRLWDSHWLNKGGRREGGGPLAQPIGSHIIHERLNTRARPGHRAVSIRIDCVLVFYLLGQFMRDANV